VLLVEVEVVVEVVVVTFTPSLTVTFDVTAQSIISLAFPVTVMRKFTPPSVAAATLVPARLPFAVPQEEDETVNVPAMFSATAKHSFAIALPWFAPFVSRASQK
jgi:hypothetical protein